LPNVNAITDAYASNRKQWVHRISNKNRNGWSDKFDCITWQARNLHALAKEARRGHHEDSLWAVLDKMAEKFRTISNKTKKDMPEAFAQAWDIPDIPKNASLRTLWADDISNRAKALLKATHGRKRCKWRKNMSTVVKNLEKKRANGVIRAFINSALRRPTKSGLSTELAVEDYIEEDVDISRISTLDNTPVSPAALLPSADVLTCLPLRNITVKSIVLQSQPGTTTALLHMQPSNMKSRTARAKSQTLKNTKKRKRNSCNFG
jgi:hypothetical protein